MKSRLVSSYKVPTTVLDTFQTSNMQHGTVHHASHIAIGIADNEEFEVMFFSNCLHFSRLLSVIPFAYPLACQVQDA